MARILDNDNAETLGCPSNPFGTTGFMVGGCGLLIAGVRFASLGIKTFSLISCFGISMSI
ncbi:MAG: hypothetical protein KBC56_07120 [Flavobacterium sp.]|nr:hypothetical protein [Flavobacterium sp.]